MVYLWCPYRRSLLGRLGCGDELGEALAADVRPVSPALATLVVRVVVVVVGCCHGNSIARRSVGCNISAESFRRNPTAPPTVSASGATCLSLPLARGRDRRGECCPRPLRSFLGLALAGDGLAIDPSDVSAAAPTALVLAPVRAAMGAPAVVVDCGVDAGAVGAVGGVSSGDHGFSIGPFRPNRADFLRFFFAQALG